MRLGDKNKGSVFGSDNSSCALIRTVKIHFAALPKELSLWLLLLIILMKFLLCFVLLVAAINVADGKTNPND